MQLNPCQSSGTAVPTRALDPQAVFGRLREICLSFPDAEEGVAWRHPMFRVAGRPFCAFDKLRDKWIIGLKVSSEDAVLRAADSRRPSACS